MRISFCVAVCLIPLLVLSCTSNKEAIIGKWERVSGPTRYYKMEFLKGELLGVGTANVVTPDKIGISIGYIFTDRNQITLIDPNLGSGRQIYRVKISKDTLNLANLSDGRIFK